MKKLFLLAYFLFSLGYAKSAGTISPPTSPEFSTHVQTSQFLPKVNPITGEYVEEEEDFVIGGSESISLRRFYNHLGYPDERYGSWRINPQSYLIANFEWGKKDRFAAVGERSGSMMNLEDCLPYSLPDGTDVACYRLDCQNTTYTNLDEIDPHNAAIVFWREGMSDGQFRWRGFVEDGTGRKREFASEFHNWHKEKTIHLKPDRNWIGHIDPNTWIPYHLPVSREVLPNGNIIRYHYDCPWREEMYYPRPRLLTSITTYNCDETKELGRIEIYYNRYYWKLDAPTCIKGVNYKEKVWEVKGYTLIGSDDRTATFYHTARKNFFQPILLHTVKTLSQETHYNYNANRFLTCIDKGDGRNRETNPG